MNTGTHYSWEGAELLGWNNCSLNANCWCLTHRHVILPKDVAATIPKGQLLDEREWRKLGVQQSRGWVHYMVHRPG